MTNVQSVITAKASPVLRNGKAKAMTTVAEIEPVTAKTFDPVRDTLTPALAAEIAFEYGKSVAGQDGTLTLAFITFKDDEKVMDDIVQSLREGYFVRKQGIDRDEAKRVLGLSKYNDRNPDKNTKANRTLSQQNVLVAANMLVSRAKRMAGITAPPAAKAKPTAKPAATGGEHPDGNAIDSDEDVNVTMVRFLQTIQAYYKKHAGDFTDDAGMAWRDWIAAAPKVILAK